MERLVSTAWLAERLGTPGLRVIDCSVALRFQDDGGYQIGSGREAWEQAHIPTSAHVDLLGELSDPASTVPLMLPPAGQMAEVMSRLGVGDGTEVVLYDSQMNMWAARAWRMLRAYGFESAAVLDGGWQAWTKEGRPVAGGAEAPPPAATFVARPQPGVFVDKHRVLAAIDEPETVIIDALQPEVHRGERQDYARAGHIPGAGNVPFAALVDPETHRYLPPDELRSLVAPALGEDARQVITYCGGGVAASSVAFALGLLGVDDVAVYDGSMLEWSADPSLPLVTGD